MNERRVVAVKRTPLRSAELETLIAHTVLGAGLSGRTTPDHVARAFRRAAQACRTHVWGAICPVCGEALPARPGLRVWVTYKGTAYRVKTTTASILAGTRVYCSEHCAVSSILRDGYSFVAEPRS